MRDARTFRGPRILLKMPYNLAPQLHIAFPTSQAILLDVRRDAYRRLSRDWSDCLRRIKAGTAPTPGETGLVRAMLNEHILVEDCSQLAWPDLSTGTLSAAAAADKSANARFGDLVALTKAHFLLRYIGLEAALARAGAKASPLFVRDADRAFDIARGMRSAKRWFPVPSLCLVSSLALHDRLSSQRLACALVIGVRDRPFAAHCWVEADGRLLNDELETVAEMTPIARL